MDIEPITTAPSNRRLLVFESGEWYIATKINGRWDGGFPWPLRPSYWKVLPPNPKKPDKLARLAAEQGHTETP